MRRAKVIEMNKKEAELNVELLKKIKFGMYKHVLVGEDGKLRDRWFIVTKDRETDVIFGFSPYTKLIRHTVKSIDTTKSETVRTKGGFLCMFMNYILIDNYERFRIDSIKDITVEHGNIFLEDYANGLVGGESKTIDSVVKAVNRLARIYSDIKDCYKKEAKGIYGLKWKERTEKGNTVFISHFRIKAEGLDHGEDIFRDMPADVFEVMLGLSKIHYPELTFAIALQAFAGLRPGEVCNVRQITCPHDGGGIKYRLVGDKLSYFEVNLRNKYPMRTDLMDVGGIKKNRVQRVYDKYLPLIKELYDNHMKMLEQYNLEDGFYPMFVNNDGKAITVKTYRDKIQRLVNVYLKKELMKSENNRFRYYAQVLTQKTLAPHFLRHFFTVRLVLDNLTPHMIAEWRGDSSLETALEYCANKEELISAIYDSNAKTVNKIFSKDS